MAVQELGGNITLCHFKLDSQEMTVAKNLIGGLAEKIGRLQEYQELRLEMKIHMKEKSRHYELSGLLVYPGTRVTAKENGMNPFVLINDVMKKMLQEVQHKAKKENKDRQR